MRSKISKKSPLLSFSSTVVSRATIAAKIDWDTKVFEGSVSYGLKSDVEDVV